MKIGLTGATGFIGSRIEVLAAKRGWPVTGYSRQVRPGLRLMPAEGLPDVSGLDAMMHLAGESVMGIWTPAKKKAIRDSRVLTTRRVVDAMLTQPSAPRVLVSASAIGYYGDTGERIADETAPLGEGFLPEVCEEWEAETRRAADNGIRVALIRIGFVLGRGGALKMIKPVFSLGLGGNLGNGRQWMSGVHVDDVAGMFLHAAENDTVRGPLNAVMPEPFRNAEFTQAVAQTLHRPAFIPAPAFALKLALGELSQLMLGSNRIVPPATLAAGYKYQYPDLRSALREALG